MANRSQKRVDVQTPRRGKLADATGPAAEKVRAEIRTARAAGKLTTPVGHSRAAVKARARVCEIDSHSTAR